MLLTLEQYNNSTHLIERQTSELHKGTLESLQENGIGRYFYFTANKCEIHISFFICNTHFHGLFGDPLYQRQQKTKESVGFNV